MLNLLQQNFNKATCCDCLQTWLLQDASTQTCMHCLKCCTESPHKAVDGQRNAKRTTNRRGWTHQKNQQTIATTSVFRDHR